MSEKKSKKTSYSQKMIVSGGVYEFYEYEKPILIGYENISKNANKGRSQVADDENKAVNRERVLNRARSDIRRLVNSNIIQNSKFLTLTFSDHVTDLEIANYEFKKFKQRLEYKLDIKLKYLCVPEFTKRNRVHYHVVCFNLPYVQNKIIREIWENGFVKINKIENCDNVGAYVCKYLTKSSADKTEGKKCYFSSRNLDKPIEIIDQEKINNIKKSLINETKSLPYLAEFENDHNKIKYIQINLNKI